MALVRGEGGTGGCTGAGGISWWWPESLFPEKPDPDRRPPLDDAQRATSYGFERARRRIGVTKLPSGHRPPAANPAVDHADAKPSRCIRALGMPYSQSHIK